MDFYNYFKQILKLILNFTVFISEFRLFKNHIQKIISIILNNILIKNAYMFFTKEAS